jgi:hypothetical protein
VLPCYTANIETFLDRFFRLRQFFVHELFICFVLFADLFNSMATDVCF